MNYYYSQHPNNNNLQLDFERTQSQDTLHPTTPQNDGDSAAVWWMLIHIQKLYRYF